MDKNVSKLLNKQKILVTGATGFIGKHLVPHLLDVGGELRLLARNKRSADFFSHPGIETNFGDLKDRESLLSACEGVDVIVHLAGSAHTSNIGHSSSRKINVDGTKTLLSAAVQNKVKRFILISSSLASRQNLETKNHTKYGVNKLDAEKIVLDAHRAGKINGTVLRPVNVYGYGMRGNLASLISLIQRGLMPPLPSLDTKISLIGVDDLSQAIVLAIVSREASGNIYSLTDGQQYLINDVEKEIYRVIGRKIPSWKIPRLLLYIGINLIGLAGRTLGALGVRIPILSSISSRTYENLVNENLFDNSQACAELGFKPTTTFFGSLPDIVSDRR
ncbi:MAG: NAD-dependent epimerase/dehydratase family protein [Gammaproteobacteria bacterium]|nr:NAD-dependent epimerase/dehydratase family protein [Gammaproteobacteria bacterium]